MLKKIIVSLTTTGLVCISSISVVAAQPSSSNMPYPEPKPVMVTDDSNGQTIHVLTGQRIVVRLNSTYWVYDNPTDLSIISMLDQPNYKAQISNLPGQGKGIVTARFQAHAAGQTLISAFRTTCGEAIGCSPAQASFSVQVDARYEE